MAKHGLGADVEAIDVPDEQTLLQAFAGLAEGRRTFDVILAIGHSNTDGIRLAGGPGGFVSWEVFAKYLRPFEPRRLVLVACEAGRWTAASILFRKLPKLRRIFASPVNTAKDLAQFMIAVVPYIVGVKAPKTNTTMWGKAAALALTGGQVREWKRDTDKDDRSAGILLDLAAHVLDPYARQVPGVLRSLLR